MSYRKKVKKTGMAEHFVDHSSVYREDGKPAGSPDYVPISPDALVLDSAIAYLRRALSYVEVQNGILATKEHETDKVDALRHAFSEAIELAFEEIRRSAIALARELVGALPPPPKRPPRVVRLHWPSQIDRVKRKLTDFVHVLETTPQMNVEFTAGRLSGLQAALEVIDAVKGGQS